LLTEGQRGVALAMPTPGTKPKTSRALKGRRKPTISSAHSGLSRQIERCCRLRPPAKIRQPSGLVRNKLAGRRFTSFHYTYPLVVNEPQATSSSPSPECPNARRRGIVFASFYWFAHVIYGALATVICYVSFGVLISVVGGMARMSRLTEAILTVMIVILSILVGIQAAYRNHQWIQRRELAKQND